LTDLHAHSSTLTETNVVTRIRDLYVVRFAVHNHYSPTVSFHQCRVISGLDLGSVRRDQGHPAKCLGRLHRNEVLTRYRLNNAITCDALDGVGHSQCRYGRVGASVHRVDDAEEQFGTGQRTSRIVDNNDVSQRHGVETRPYRSGPRVTANHDEVCTLAGTRVVAWHHENYDVSDNAGALDGEGRHSLSSEGSELLLATEASPAAAGHDDCGNIHD
jgi:hypothetical protein